MKILMVASLALFSFLSYAGSVDCALRDSKVASLCSDPARLEKAEELNYAYLSAVSASISIEELKAVAKLKSKFTYHYVFCNIYSGAKLGECIDASFDKSHGLFPSPPLGADLIELGQRVKVKYAEQLERASAMLRLCVISKSRSLDDEISPAIDIATGVSRACRSEVIDRVDLFDESLASRSVFEASPLSWQRKEEMTNQLSDPANFVHIVLESRADKRTQKRVKPHAPDQKSKPKKTNPIM